VLLRAFLVALRSRFFQAGVMADKRYAGATALASAQAGGHNEVVQVPKLFVGVDNASSGFLRLLGADAGRDGARARGGFVWRVSTLTLLSNVFQRTSGYSPTG
jgi:hypothetical protein